MDGFLGTKPKEDISYAKANEVNLWITVTTCICCVLEIILYFVFNRMVNNNYYHELQFHLQIHPWLPIINGITLDEVKAEENKSDENKEEEIKPEEKKQEENKMVGENKAEENKTQDNEGKGEKEEFEMAEMVNEEEIKRGDP